MTKLSIWVLNQLFCTLEWGILNVKIEIANIC